MEHNTIRTVLEYATRAPSTHNSQPWLFKVGENKVTIFYNEKYFLPYADRDGRDMYISFGCMLENLKVASLHFGFEAEINFTENQGAKIATVNFKKTNEKNNFNDVLFEAIPKRVNARGMFQEENIKSDVVSEIISLKEESDLVINFVTDKEKIKKIADITKKSIVEAYKEKGFRKEMSHWMNSNISRKKEGLPGYSLKMPFILSFFIPVLIRYFNMGKLLSSLSAKAVASAPLIISISCKNSKENWLKTGMLSERIMLYLQSKGFQTSIYVGSIEIGKLFKEVQEVLRSVDRPQFLFTVGHISGEHRITPRHKIEDKII